MPLVGRPEPGKTLPKSLPQPAVAALLAALDADRDSRATAWCKRDLAIVSTGLLAGLRADELRRADVGNIRTADAAARSSTCTARAARTARCPSRPT